VPQRAGRTGRDEADAPAVTVRSFLEDPVVARGGPELLAGAEGLDRRVRWVHISDQPDIAGYLRGGEVLLTSGGGVPTEQAAAREYVRSLADVGVAALVVHAGRGADPRYDAMAAEAAGQGLPLVRLNHRVGFVEITRALHERLLDSELGFLRRTDGLRGELMRLLMDNRGITVLVDRLSEALDRAVVVEDAWGQVVAMSWSGHGVDEVLELWSQRVATTASRSAGPASAEVAPGVAWTPLLARGAAWGRLLCLDYGSGMSAEDASIMDVGAAVLNLAIATQSDVRLAVDQARDDLVVELATQRMVSATQLRRRAASLGVRLGAGAVYGYLLHWRGFRRWSADVRLTEADRREVLEELRAGAERLSRPGCSAGLAAVRDEQVLGILQPADGEQVEGRLQDVVANLAEDIGGRWGTSSSVVAGLSTRAALGEAGRALEEARAAAEYAGMTARGQGVFRFSDLGLHRLLTHLADQGRLAGYVHSQLAPLVDHDRAGRSQLVETLRCYLAHGGRATEAAQTLFIERRTLYHRLRTIRSLLGCDLDSHETRLRLGVALLGLAVLEAKPVP
jgi:purine catabolism regulator